MGTATPISVDGTPTNGANKYIDSLVWGGRWDSVGEKTVVTYSFQSGDDPFNFFTTGNGGSWSDTEKNALRNALSKFENVANIEFVETTNVWNADLWYWQGNNSQFRNGTLAWHEVPDSGVAEPLYGAFNNQGFGWTSQGLSDGGFGQMVMIHELGHGLGLAHPHDGGAQRDGNPFPGVDSPFGDFGKGGWNQGVYTTMSYNSGWASEYPDHTSSIYGHASTPMALDIEALQLLYGANTTHMSGSDTYRLPSTNGAGTSWQSIWDTGGDDTITNEGIGASVTIDLRAAGEIKGNYGGFISHVHGIKGGFTIAKGAKIENATGGTMDDILQGNMYDNVLRGNQGNDMFWTNGGNDDLFGGSGNDMFYLTEGDHTIDGGADVDGFHFMTNLGVTIDLSNTAQQDTGAGMLTISDVENIVAGNGFDILTGNASANRLVGNKGRDQLRGNEGADEFFGGSGLDMMFAGVDNDQDVFQFSGVKQSRAGSKRDQIFEFDLGEDLLDLSLIDAKKGAGGNQTFKFKGTKKGAYSVWYKAKDLDGTENDFVTVSADVNGDKRADFQVRIFGVNSIAVDDIIL